VQRREETTRTDSRNITASRKPGSDKQTPSISVTERERFQAFSVLNCFCWFWPWNFVGCGCGHCCQHYRDRGSHSLYIMARGSVIVKALCYKREGRVFETQWGELIFSSYLILPVTLGPGVHSASNRSEYQKQRNNVSGEVEYGRCVGLTTLPPSVSWLSRQCGILNIS
jgi:hypothetical protein